MGLLDWLFGRKPRVDDIPMKPLNLAPLEPTQPQRPVPTAVSAPSIDREEYAIDYTVPGFAMGRRRVRFLIATPPGLLTGIDLEKRRVRHYQKDRISLVIDPRTGETFDASSLARILGGAFPIDIDPDVAPAIETALILRKSMISQLSIMCLIARADGYADGRSLETIMDYTRRESRFAVREGWVPRGPKSDAWAPLRTMVSELTPRRADLEAYVTTLNEDWDNPRRMTAFNEALNALVGLKGRPGPGVQSIIDEVDQIARLNKR